MPINISLKAQSAKDAEEVLFPDSHSADECSWISGHEEGQLAVDVAETEKEIVLRSAIAGVKRQDLDVLLHNDMLTVRGVRSAPEEPDARYLVRECHWGSFSRSIILPTDIDPDRISAELKDGVLTVRLPKVERSKRIEVDEVE